MLNRLFFIHCVRPDVMEIASNGSSRSSSSTSASSSEPTKHTILAFMFDEGRFETLWDLQQDEAYRAWKDEMEKRFGQHEWSEIPMFGPEGDRTLGYRLYGWDMDDAIDKTRAYDLIEGWNKLFDQMGLQVSPILLLQEGEVLPGQDVPDDRSPWDTATETDKVVEEKEPLSLYDQAVAVYHDQQ